MTIFQKISLVIIACFVTFTGLLVAGTGVYADTRTDVCTGVQYAIPGTSCTGTTVDIVWGWAFTIINWVLIAVGILCVVFIIIGGIRYITSSGDPEKVKSAKNTILYALIGLVIAILANVIVQVVFSATSAVTDPEPRCAVTGKTHLSASDPDCN